MHDVGDQPCVLSHSGGPTFRHCCMALFPAECPCRRTSVRVRVWAQVLVQQARRTSSAGSRTRSRPMRCDKLVKYQCSSLFIINARQREHDLRSSTSSRWRRLASATHAARSWQYTCVELAANALAPQPARAYACPGIPPESRAHLLELKQHFAMEAHQDG